MWDDIINNGMIYVIDWQDNELVTLKWSENISMPLSYFDVSLASAYKV